MKTITRIEDRLLINKLSATHRFEVYKNGEWVTYTLGTLQQMEDYQEAFMEDGEAEGYYEGETPPHRITGFGEPGQTIVFRLLRKGGRT